METASTVNPSALRQAMGRFPTGVTVVTTETKAGPLGCTISAFCSVSLDPPLVLVSVGRERGMHGPLTQGRGFVVNVLGEDQADVAMTFAKPVADRFSRVETTCGRYGPRITDAIAVMECELHDALPCGDHTLAIGRVRDLDVRSGNPLVYADGAFLEVSA